MSNIHFLIESLRMEASPLVSQDPGRGAYPTQKQILDHAQSGQLHHDFTMKDGSMPVPSRNALIATKTAVNDVRPENVDIAHRDAFSAHKKAERHHQDKSVEWTERVLGMRRDAQYDSKVRSNMNKYAKKAEEHAEMASRHALMANFHRSVVFGG